LICFGLPIEEGVFCVRVLITGGYGFIGAWIIRNLLAQGDQVWVYDLKEDPRRLRPIMPESEVKKVVFVQGDVTDQANLQKAIADHQISHIIHLAGLQVPTCRANPILGAQVNVIGTLAVFEAVRLAGDQIKRLVYASSAAVFGPPEKYPKGPLPDDVKLLPSTHYGYFKCCNEGNATVYSQDFGVSSVGLRPWTVYGVGRDLGMTSEPTKAIKSVAINRPYHISYGGWQDLQFVDDVAKIFVRCLERPYNGAKSYNIRGHVIDLKGFHRALCTVEPAAAKLVTHGDRQLAIAFDLDDAALQKDLGPMPRTSLEDGIRQTLEAFRQLHKEGRLDISDLETTTTPAVVRGDEP
jgi:nucleoside-diphosphate-sugar epimerase